MMPVARDRARSCRWHLAMLSEGASDNAKQCCSLGARHGESGNATTDDATRTAFWIAVLAISGLTIRLRLWEVNGLGFNSDEAVCAGQAAAIARVPQLSEIFPIFRRAPVASSNSL